MAKPKADIDYLSKLSRVFNERDEVYLPSLKIHYTPAEREPIETTARNVYKQLRDMELDAVIHFPGFDMKVEMDWKPDDIVEFYYDMIDEIRRLEAAERRAALRNAKKPPKLK